MGPVRQATPSALAVAWTGAAAFLASLLYFLYAYFVRFGTVEAREGSAAGAVALDVGLFTVFALHHSLLARSTFKRRIQRLVDPALERSIYTWSASLLFFIVCAWWQPVPGTLYEWQGAAALPAYGVQLLGLATAVRSSARLDVLDLAGVRSVLRSDAAGAHRAPQLVTTGLYAFVRHPLYLGWVLLVFGAPHMTMTRFLFAAVSTAYLVIATPFEERSLVHAFGAEYRRYQQRVRWRIVPGIY